MFNQGLVKTSLEVAFPGGKLPEKFVRYRAKTTRSIPLMAEFPYEDAQFDVVMMDGAAVSPVSVRESHRVLRGEGVLVFSVPERTNKQPGYTMPELYSLLREGYNLVQVERPAWWRFGCSGRFFTIFAQKKTWKPYRGLTSGKLSILSPFASVK